MAFNRLKKWLLADDISSADQEINRQNYYSMKRLALISVPISLLSALGQYMVEARAAFIFNLLLDNHKKELALALWNAGADEMKADKEGEIPLFQAIRKQHTELVMAIVASMVADGRGDSDLNLYREEELGKFSAFSIAAVLSDIKIVEAMLKAGGNPLAQDYFGMTPLYYAAEKGYEDKVELMLKFIPENLPDEGKSVEKAAEDRDSSFRIHMLLHELEEPYREVFELRVFGELSFREIGMIFRKTENWARVTYHRARIRLQERMGDQ